MYRQGKLTSFLSSPTPFHSSRRLNRSSDAIMKARAGQLSIDRRNSSTRNTVKAGDGGGQNEEGSRCTHCGNEIDKVVSRLVLSLLL